MVSKTLYYTLILLILISGSGEVTGRAIRNDSLGLFSDGAVNYFGHVKPSIIRFKGVESSDDDCEHLYGFLPCSNTLWGNLFLIIVYEYLLFHGESYMASGGEQIFKILGPGIFGASAFHIISSFPEASMLLVSGLLNSEATAQEYVLTGVGLLAGSTIFLLTLLWGTCVVLGATDFSTAEASNPIPNPTPKPFQSMLSFFTGSGVTTDLETSYTARIMVLSVIPFLIILLPTAFNLTSWERPVILFALVISFLFLLAYFLYGVFTPWIQKRRLEFVKHEHLVIGILQHVQRYALGNLLTEDGAPDVHAIRRLFEEIDVDADNNLSPYELKDLLLKIKFRKLHLDKDKAVTEVLQEFDLDGDQKITKDEFVMGFTKWLDETRNALDRRCYSEESLKDLYHIFQPWIQKKREEFQMKKTLISEFLKHAQSYALGNFLGEDGTPDLPNIKSLFERMDIDGDNRISKPELKELITGIKFGKMPLDVDDAVNKIMEELDTNADHLISEEEFITGFVKWLSNPSNDHAHHPPIESSDEIYQKTWEVTDKLIDSENNRPFVKSLWVWVKALAPLILGIVMLGLLAEPLINSVQGFSESAGLPAFSIAFVLVPMATTARQASTAIKAARRKKPRTTSLTFSEIYDAVFMNNVLGFCVLLSLIYFRGFTWNFSAEVLIVLIVSAIMGTMTSLRSTIPVWTVFIAYLLYPISLIFVYIFHNDSSLSYNSKHVANMYRKMF